MSSSSTKFFFSSFSVRICFKMTKNYQQEKKDACLYVLLDVT